MTVESMTDDVPWYVSFIVAWLPYMIFIGGVAWHGRQVRKSTTGLAQVVDDLVREMKRANDIRSGR